MQKTGTNEIASAVSTGITGSSIVLLIQTMVLLSLKRERDPVFHDLKIVVAN
jgi:hypothetical protein